MDEIKIDTEILKEHNSTKIHCWYEHLYVMKTIEEYINYLNKSSSSIKEKPQIVFNKEFLFNDKSNSIIELSNKQQGFEGFDKIYQIKNINDISILCKTNNIF